MLPMLQRLIEMHGLDALALAREVGINLSKIPTPEERIPVDKVDELIQIIIPHIEDPAFGLKAVRCWHPANLGVLGYAWLSSSTLRSALGRFERYQHLIGERGVIEIEEIPQGLKVRFWARRGDPDERDVATVIIDITMSLLIDMCRINAGAALRPLAVSLRRKLPKHVVPYEAFFGCPVQFGASENAVVLSPRDTDQALPSSNKQLAVVLDKMLSEELARLDKSNIVARCCAAILESLTSGEFAEAHAAAQLNMSPRTLQRKLAEANLTYYQLVDETRRDLALRYITDPGRSISEITFSLGFSQPSALTRAFKRWTGLTPSEHRQNHLPRHAA